jgi:hypothetical protein
VAPAYRSTRSRRCWSRAPRKPRYLERIPVSRQRWSVSLRRTPRHIRSAGDRALSRGATVRPCNVAASAFLRSKAREIPGRVGPPQQIVVVRARGFGLKSGAGGASAASQDPESFLNSFQEVRRHGAIAKHESSVGDGPDLVNEQVRVMLQISCLLDANSQREIVSRGQRVYLTGARNDDGRRMTGSVERVGLDYERRPFFLARFLSVRLRFEVDGPDLTAPNDGFGHSRPSEVLFSMNPAAEALWPASRRESSAMRSCINRSSNSSIARRAYSDLLTPKRLAVASMLAAKALGIRREKEMRSSIGLLRLAPVSRIVIQIVGLSSSTQTPCPVGLR